MRFCFLAAVASVGALSVAGEATAATCPAIGNDRDCGAIITITDTGSSISFTGQGPYDGADDTLVGVVNNSSQPIYAMGLRSTTDIFGFDGDGIRSYGAPGNSRDNTGYGGPNAYFSNIGAGSASGVVNFINPVQQGTATYFSLEEALTKPTAIQDIVNNSIAVTLGGRFDGSYFGATNFFRPTTINATFTPNGGLTLAQAAQQTGFTSFQWQQTVTDLPGPSPFTQVGNPVPLTTPPPFLDPPKGGYDYCAARGFTACLTSYPFYPTDPGTTNASTLGFFDSPGDPNLPPGSSIKFKTELLGVLPGFITGTDCLRLALPTCVDLGVGFSWNSTYNGTHGGISETASNTPVDPDGFGGITLDSLSEISDYSPFSVSTINGIPVGSASGVPEPSTYALMIASFFLVGRQLRLNNKWRRHGLILS